MGDGTFSGIPEKYVESSGSDIEVPWIVIAL